MNATTDTPATPTSPIRTAVPIGGYDLAAEITGLCKGTLYALVCQKRIPHVRISSRLVRFHRAALEAWLAARAVGVER